jgi:hypothetical protein
MLVNLRKGDSKNWPSGYSCVLSNTIRKQVCDDVKKLQGLSGKRPRMRLGKA